MTRFTTSLAIAAAIVVLAVASVRAGEFDQMPNREYSGFVRDRIAALTSEAEAMERIGRKHWDDCRRATPGIKVEDGARACEIIKAARIRQRELLDEERALMTDLARRYGGDVPAWARRADAAFLAACRHPADPGTVATPSF